MTLVSSRHHRVRLRFPLHTVLFTVLATLAFSVPANTQTQARAADTAYSFVDVPPGTQFFTEISWLASEEITTGYPVDRVREYRPTTAVNRDTMAAFLYRYAGSPRFTPPATSPFADVAPSNQFYTQICWLAAQGISTGTLVDGQRYYKPLEPVARDAMAAFLYRFSGEPAVPRTAASAFVDVPANNQFVTEITWLASESITTGWTVDGQRVFRPLDSVNRDAMAAFMYRHAGEPEFTAPQWLQGDDYPSELRAPARDALTDPWRFYNRECVSFVAWRLNQSARTTEAPYAFSNYMTGPNGTQVRFGGATSWAAAAAAGGWTVSSTPKAGDVAWWASGHVAWVVAVNADGTVVTEEYNWYGDGAYHTRMRGKADSYLRITL